MGAALAIRTIVGVVILLAVAFSGCVGSEATEKKTSESPTAPAPAPTVSADTGSIAGVATDPELAPLPGVQVALLELATATATSDGEGKFTINGVPAGAYKLVAQKLGYESSGKSLSVVAGEVAEVRVTLQPVAISEAYTEYYPYQGFFNSGVSTPVVTVRPGYLTNPESERSIFDTNVSNPKQLKSVVDAMAWDASAPLTAKRFLLDLKVDGSTKNSTNGPSPLFNRIDDVKPKTKDGRINHWTWIAFTQPTVDPTTTVVVVFQQKFMLYSTLFFGEDAPEGYSSLPPG